MEKGMIFDLYQDGQETKRVMAINKCDVMCLSGCVGEIIKNIDFENDVESILIDDIIQYGNHCI
jgi:hypothetical protein